MGYATFEQVQKFSDPQQRLPLKRCRACPRANVCLRTLTHTNVSVLHRLNYLCNAQDVKAEVVAEHPRLYAETMRETRTSFFLNTARWLLEAVWHSAVGFGDAAEMYSEIFSLHRLCFL